MSKVHEKFELLLFSKNGSLLIKVGTYDDEVAALEAVNPSMDLCPSAASWKVIKIRKSVASEGKGFRRVHRKAPAPKDRGRWW
ncbi:MAG: hypothetical protein AB7V39_03025 [Nitrospiraceae bacterium]